jgi:hypothetical protein
MNPMQGHSVVLFFAQAQKERAVDEIKAIAVKRVALAYQTNFKAN